MAEAIVGSVLGDVVKSLAISAHDEVTALWGVGKEIEAMDNMFSMIQAVIRDAENKHHSEAVRNWFGDLQDVLYDAEDILDEWQIETMRRKIETDKIKQVFNIFKAHVFSWRISNKVREIRKKLDLLAKDRHSFLPAYGDVDGGMEPESIERETSSFVDEAGIFGTREVTRGLTEFLLSPEVVARNLSVISIVGMGGIGKTTLAQLVYNDEIVTEQFDLKMWIYVSPNLVVQKLTKAMINSATYSENHNLEEHDPLTSAVELDRLQRTLRNILRGKRFLLVLDDVWNVTQAKWDSLRIPLTAGADGSTVLVTTRSEAVSRLMGTVRTHRLEGLSESDCWSLFKQQAFGEESLEAHSRLAEIGREIVKKCQGLPLAAKNLGGILASKRDERHWKYILESELWDLPTNSNEILPVLKRSYNHLPAHLKWCFAYCSLFPKHYEFSKIDLIHLWMAEGFIQPEARKQPEDTGLEYFDDLLLASFFQYSKHNDGEPVYKMHNLIHDLAQLVSNGACFRVDS